MACPNLAVGIVFIRKGKGLFILLYSEILGFPGVAMFVGNIAQPFTAVSNSLLLQFLLLWIPVGALM